jgi:RimJ/RimL family protein N-acetyltransferase
MGSPAIRTERLTLTPFTADAIDALLAGDALRLAALTTAAFPSPLAPPPLMEDILPALASTLRADPAQEGWWAWVVIRRDTGQCVGSVGLGGPPDAEGAVVMGYATYPGFEGHGFATEAAQGLLQWALQQPGVKRVAATIPPWNEQSVRIAEKIGMQRVGAMWDEEVGDVLLFAADRKA